MRPVGAILGGVARLVAGLMVALVLLGWLALWLGAGLGALVATPVVFAIFDSPPGESAWQWMVVAPLMLCGAVLAFGHGRETSGADRVLGSGDSHGSARFTGTRELRKLDRADGLPHGRRHRGRLLRDDGPAHLLRLVLTRAGKGGGTMIPNLLAVDRSALVINPKGEKGETVSRIRSAGAGHGQSGGSRRAPASASRSGATARPRSSSYGRRTGWTPTTAGGACRTHRGFRRALGPLGGPLALSEPHSGAETPAERPSRPALPTPRCPRPSRGRGARHGADGERRGPVLASLSRWDACGTAPPEPFIGARLVGSGDHRKVETCGRHERISI